MFVKEVKSGTRGTKIFLTCDVCGKEYTSSGSRYRGRKTSGDYCSSECRTKSKKLFLTCVNCGKSYTRFKSTYAGKNSTCCSRKCQFEQQKKGGEISQKTVETNLKKYGVERPAQCEVVLEKYRDNEAWQSSLFEKGRTPWNAGVLEGDDERWDKVLQRMRENHPSKTNKRDDWVEKIRETTKEGFATGKRTSPFCFFTEEQRHEYLQLAAKARCQQPRSFSGWYETKIGERLHYDSTW